MKLSITILFVALLLPWAAAQTNDTATHYEVAEAQPAFRQVMLTGFTRARATLPLVAENTGKVLYVVADIGDSIGSDGLFARIDSTFIELDLAGNRVQQAQLRNRIDFDRKETERHEELIKKGSTSFSQLDQLQTTLQDNRHQLANLEVQEKILQERLQRTRVTAPKGWRVTARHIEPGQRVSEGEKVGEVADFSTLLVPFALSPEQLAALRQSESSLTVQLPDWRRNAKARLYRLNPGFDDTTRKIAVELALTGELPAQRGGLRVQLPLAVPEKTGAVTLPVAAVKTSYDEHWVIRDNGERIPVVKLGEDRNSAVTHLRVASPLIKPGDRFRIEKD